MRKPEAAAERTLNIQQYLTEEKGIDPGRIEVRVGDTSGRTANNILIPTGATYNDANTQRFDEKAIVRHGQAYGTGTSRAPVVHRRPRRRSTTTKPDNDASIQHTSTDYSAITSGKQISAKLTQSAFLLLAQALSRSERPPALTSPEGSGRSAAW
jgi:hypothetical protein